MSRSDPIFSITPRIAGVLMRIEAAKEAVSHLPITTSVLASLRETARLYSTHYSTMIEGNRLTQEQVLGVVANRQHFPGRERDEKEVMGYYAAIEKVEQLAVNHTEVTEQQIKLLHALVMAGGVGKVRPTPFRDGQNVIRDSRSNRIVYMPPEAKDVPSLMKQMVAWLNTSADQGIPCPIRAGVAHYQFATIHPYYDGNGRTARLLTTLILHQGGYGLKGLYSLEEYYARDLRSYYQALSIGTSHNYYGGRATCDITKWVDYFCAGVAESFENVKKRAQAAANAGEDDASAALRKLDPRQRKGLELFRHSEAITSRDVQKLFTISQRGARNILSDWVTRRFIVVSDPAKKSRKYALAREFKRLLR
ncbi:MAG: Fic family protein [Tepidisphaeraceae bacterium]|jgi:Fic family protein